ncbi:MAG: hypothetical protein C4523_04285 [Myxococcales bacterium]|nr:MAG: hypothetical protein C4523_04285 [Myxococcales bacterium]
MALRCDACLLTCEDFRLHARPDGRNIVGEFVRSLGVDCDVLTRAGAAQDLVRPRLGFDEAILRDMEVSVLWHGVKTIIILNHEDCGAYAHFGFASREIELEKHFADLAAAREVVKRCFAEVNVLLYFAELEQGTTDRYVVRAVNLSP